MERLSDGFAVFCKRECASCMMVVPVMKDLREGDHPLTIYTQDDPAFPDGIPGVIDDTELERSYHLHIETVPTLIRVENGEEVARAVGYDPAAVYVPHPIQDRTDDEMKEIAQSAVGELMKAIGAV